MKTRPPAKLSIKKAGAACSIQDLGRRGFQHFGLSQGGAADVHAFSWANYLIDNPINSAAVEITLGQFSAEFEAETEIAISGAEAVITINGASVPLWRSLKINAGDLLEIKLPRSGLVNYLSVKGGLRCEQHFASRSIVIREKTGPNEGASLSAGDCLDYTLFKKTHSSSRVIPPQYIPNYNEAISLRAMTTAESKFFNSSELETFFSSSYSINAQSNRMGYRLQGPNIQPKLSTLPSEGINFGAVQVPPDGKPIILLSDRQTLGGYPKIASVSKLDCYRLAQRRPGQEIRFEEASVPQCQRALREFLNFFSI